MEFIRYKTSIINIEKIIQIDMSDGSELDRNMEISFYYKDEDPTDWQDFDSLEDMKDIFEKLSQRLGAIDLGKIITL